MKLTPTVNRCIAAVLMLAVIATTFILNRTPASPEEIFRDTYYPIAQEIEDSTGIPAPISLALLGAATKEGSIVDSSFNPFRTTYMYTSNAAALVDYTLELKCKTPLSKNSGIASWCSYLQTMKIADSATFHTYVLQLSGSKLLNYDTTTSCKGRDYQSTP